MGLQGKNSAMINFLARMSHEIGTPIAFVQGKAQEEMNDPNISPKTKEAFENIHLCTNKLISIVNDILDLSKVEAGEMSVEGGKYNVADMIQNVILLNLIHLEDKDEVDFLVQIDEWIPLRLFGDVLRIKQILTNLLSNAFKYTNRGQVELCIEAEDNEDDDCAHLIITIKDTGLGMTAEQLNLLKNEQARFHEHESEILGTGLGLPITLNLLQLMNAEIEVESKVSVGTTVRLTIPQEYVCMEVFGTDTARKLENIDRPDKAKKPKFLPEPMPDKKVLVVDNTPATAQVAKGFLSMYQIQADSCDSGFAAIDKIKAGNEYDMILMDCMTPRMDGIETVEILRKMGFDNPIVAFKAKDSGVEADEFLNNGFDGFIYKPIEMARFDALLKSVLKKTISREAENSNEPSNVYTTPDMIDTVRKDFLNTQQNACDKIKQALSEGDFRTAHRDVHALKNFAMLLNDRMLGLISEIIEASLKRGMPLQSKHMEILEREVRRIVEEINETD